MTNNKRGKFKIIVGTLIALLAIVAIVWSVSRLWQSDRELPGVTHNRPRNNEMSLEEMSETAEADHELLQRVTSSLHHQRHRSIRTLEIQIERGTAVLQGRVPTFYMRQIAVECVKRVAGVTQIIDRIDVVYLADDCGVIESSEVESITAVVSTDHRMGFSNAVRAIQDKRRVHFNRRPLLSSAKG